MKLLTKYPLKLSKPRKRKDFQNSYFLDHFQHYLWFFMTLKCHKTRSQKLPILVLNAAITKRTFNTITFKTPSYPKGPNVRKNPQKKFYQFPLSPIKIYLNNPLELCCWVTFKNTFRQNEKKSSFLELLNWNYESFYIRLDVMCRHPYIIANKLLVKNENIMTIFPKKIVLCRKESPSVSVNWSSL